MKKLFILFVLLLFLNQTSYSQNEDLFFIKMDKKMQFKKAKDTEILYLTLQHRKFKVKHIYLFKVDRKNVFQVKDKKGKIIEIVGITKKDIYTRGELRRIKPPILDQILKNKASEKLHDDIGGSLAAMKMRLTQLNDPNYYSSLKNEIKILDDIYDEVRTLSKDLNVKNKFNNNLEEFFENLVEEVRYNFQKVG